MLTSVIVLSLVTALTGVVGKIMDSEYGASPADIWGVTASALYITGVILLALS